MIDNLTCSDCFAAHDTLVTGEVEGDSCVVISSVRRLNGPVMANTVNASVDVGSEFCWYHPATTDESRCVSCVGNGTADCADPSICSNC